MGKRHDPVVIANTANGARNYELAASHIVLFRRHILGQCGAAFCQRRDGKALPDTLRKGSGKGLSSSTINVLWGRRRVRRL